MFVGGFIVGCCIVAFLLATGVLAAIGFVLLVIKEIIFGKSLTNT